MGLGEIPLDGISRKKVGRQLRQPAFHENAPINAFDTETRPDGRIYLLSYVYDGPEWGSTHIGNSDFSPLEAEEIFEVLIRNKTQQPAVNVWFNLDFDANALIGTILSEYQMKELADTNKTTFEYNDSEYQLTYIKGKFLSIQDENRHKSTHYDISQFFHSTLETAAKNWLGLEKGDIDFEELDSYSWEEITKYAEKDAELTQKLWKLFVDLGENELGIPFGKPISTGFVAQHVVFNQLYQKPAWSSTQFQKLARKAYHGGRFEVYRRGFFDDVIGLDINSAYPYHMAQMPDLGSCNVQVIGGNVNDMRAADWGFVTATVTTDKQRNIQPFAVKDRIVYFPALEETKLTVTIDEFLFALDNGYLVDYNIHKTGLVYETDHVNRPFEFLKEWYDDRNDYKKLRQEKNDKYDKFQYILKVIMNSKYGKTCQVTEKHEYIEDSDSFDTQAHEFVTEGYTGEPVKGWFEAGDLFNPFYASYITAKTRLQLHQAALDLGVEDSAIMFATDCLMLEADNVSQKAIDEMLAPEDLGKWDYDYRGSAFVVGSGVYDVFEDGKLSKMAKRGFREVSKTYDSWRQAARQANGKITIPNERPARFKEWLLHDGHPRPAEFFEDNRQLNPEFDSKRGWHRQTDFNDLLSNNHGSEPLTISESP